MNISRLVSLAAFALFLAFQATVAQASHTEHKIVIQVDENDKGRMNLALNNAQNVSKYFQSKGEKVQIQIVAYGPGLHMLRSDTSPVKKRIEAMSLAMDNITFDACGNTRAKMAKKEGKTIPLMAEAKEVSSGVVTLMHLQEHGWSYVRP